MALRGACLINDKSPTALEDVRSAIASNSNVAKNEMKSTIEADFEGSAHTGARTATQPSMED